MKSKTNEKQKTEKKPRVKRKKSADKERYYVNGKEFHNAIAEFYATGDFEICIPRLAFLDGDVYTPLSSYPPVIIFCKVGIEKGAVPIKRIRKLVILIKRRYALYLIVFLT